MRRSLCAFVLLAALCGCGGTPSRVGMVDVQKLISQWPAAERIHDQIETDRRSLVAASTLIDLQAQSDGLARLTARNDQFTQRVLRQVKKDAKAVAQEKGLRMIVTRDFVGYGGDDVTDAVVRKIRDEGAAADATLGAAKTPEAQ